MSTNKISEFLKSKRLVNAHRLNGSTAIKTWTYSAILQYNNIKTFLKSQRDHC